MVTVRIYHIPGPVMACDACLSSCPSRNRGCPDPSEATKKLKDLLDTAFPGEVSVEYIDLHQTPERGREEDMLISSRMYPSPLVKIDGKIAFVGHIPVEEIIDMVRKLCIES